MPAEVPPSWPTADAAGLRDRDPLDRALHRRRRRRLRALRRHPDPGLRGRQGGGQAHQRGGQRDPRTRSRPTGARSSRPPTSRPPAAAPNHASSAARRCRSSRASRTPTTTTRRSTAGPSASRRPRSTRASAPYVDGKLRRIKVTKRGDSPRIDYANLIGSRGTTEIRGDTLAAALGLYDRWAYFKKAGSRSGAVPSRRRSAGDRVARPGRRGRRPLAAPPRRPRRSGGGRRGSSERRSPRPRSCSSLAGRRRWSSPRRRLVASSELAAGREGVEQRVGDQPAARRVARRGEVDAVVDEPDVLDVGGPVVDPHVRVVGAGRRAAPCPRPPCSARRRGRRRRRAT